MQTEKEVQDSGLFCYLFVTQITYTAFLASVSKLKIELFLSYSAYRKNRKPASMDN